LLSVIADTVHVEISYKGRRTIVAASKLSVSGTTLSIDAEAVPVSVLPASKVGTIRVGFLGVNEDLTNKYYTISNTSDIQTLITGPLGGASWFNPLAYGAEIAVTNSGSSVNVIGVTPAAGAEDVSNAVTILENKPNVYAIAGLTQSAAELAKLASHATFMSAPDNKGERIVFGSKDSSGEYTGTDFPSSADKLLSAEAISDYADAINNKRYFAIHPDVVYVRESTHVNSLSTDFIQAVFGSSFTYLPKLANPISFQDGNVTKTYPRGTEVNATVLAKLITIAESNSTSNFDVLVPVPGYYLAAGIAGQIAVKEPQQPLTNTAVAGPFVETKYSNDYFSQSQLDVIASGGTWVIEDKGGAMVTRHQLSTDVSSIQTRELSVTTQVDFAAKFLRQLVEPTIGVNVISDAFLAQLRTAFNAASTELVEIGALRELNIINVYQDEANPDTVKADFELLPLYPVNYIKITLTF
jgi:hypothetical protein